MAGPLDISSAIHHHPQVETEVENHEETVISRMIAEDIGVTVVTPSDALLHRSFSVLSEAGGAAAAAAGVALSVVSPPRAREDYTLDGAVRVPKGRAAAAAAGAASSVVSPPIGREDYSLSGAVRASSKERAVAAADATSSVVSPLRAREDDALRRVRGGPSALPRRRAVAAAAGAGIASLVSPPRRAVISKRGAAAGAASSVASPPRAGEDNTCSGTVPVKKSFWNSFF